VDKNPGIGLFGGTFDPIHIGHLITAEEVRDLFGLDEIVFTPSNRSPHKPDRPMASARDRYEMVALATKSNPYFSVDDIELVRGGTSYTVDTVREFRERRGDEVSLHLVIGADLMLDLESWKDPDQLLALVTIIVMSRPGYDLRQVPEPFRGRFEVARVSHIDISSTMIRQRVLEGRSVRYLVPDAVEAYISAKELYRGR